jgi:hypothetical protein
MSLFAASQGLILDPKSSDIDRRDPNLTRASRWTLFSGDGKQPSAASARLWPNDSQDPPYVETPEACPAHILHILDQSHRYLNPKQQLRLEATSHSIRLDLHKICRLLPFSHHLPSGGSLSLRTSSHITILVILRLAVPSNSALLASCPPSIIGRRRGVFSLFTKPLSD